MSLPKVLPWQRLRGSKAGAKFRRQHPIGPYVADFCCRDARVVIEIDGEVHAIEGAQDRDQLRERFLSESGYRVVRVPARVVLADADAAAASIAVLVATPLHHPSNGSPPRAGGELR